MSCEANVAPHDPSSCTARAENPHCGICGDPFMYSTILDSPSCCLILSLVCTSTSNRLPNSSPPRLARFDECQRLQRQGMNLVADPRAEHAIDQLKAMYLALARKPGRDDDSVEVVPVAANFNAGFGHP